jgi:hypothetical protein
LSPPLVFILPRTFLKESNTAAGIIAGLLVQNCLKHLLNFGQVTQYLGYASLTDFFPTMAIKPNPGCVNPLCLQKQKEWQAGAAAREVKRAAAEAEAGAVVDDAPVHESNEWGIEVVSNAATEQEDEATAVGPSQAPAAAACKQDAGANALPVGLRFEHPAARVDAEEVLREAVGETGEDVDDLMARLGAAMGE